MPIKKENRDRYPKNWKEIREKVLKRAKNRCEFCGVKNHAVGYRDWDGVFHYYEEKDKKDEEMYGVIYHSHPYIKIVLTIAHLDHTPENCDLSNLRALCQKCHNKYDAKHRAQTRRATRESKKLTLF